MAQIIPDWVKEALNEKLARGDIGFASCGVYTVYVEQHNECWCGRLDADLVPTWYGWEGEPMSRPGCRELTWKDFYVIYQV